MEQNITRTYLFYAIGEIALVMIGILLALQVNNWNETRQERSIAAELKTAMLSDLRSDLHAIDSTMAQLNTAIALFDTLQVKITDPGAVKAEVVEALKYDFSPFIPRFGGFNDYTYRSSSNSGTIAFLDQSIKEKLYGYYLMQSNASEIFTIYEQQYLNTINDLNAEFPLNVDFVPFNLGPVYENKWTDPDFDELTSKFNKAGTAQRNYFRLMNRNLPAIRDTAQKLIKELEG